ncbi:putative sulfate exporter family transporter [Streptococcaceae bacterium ESL0687]|nr:putative sulfate exporter family transporter [Streptococcaceae bacterium ESL0687]
MKINIKQLLPGILLSICLAFISKLLANFIPQIGSASLALVLGILLGNTKFQEQKWEPGTKFSESKFLEVSVLLLGFSVNVTSILSLGFKSFFYIVILMTLTIMTIVSLGKKISINKKLSLLVAGGTAVCGSSAIASIAPSIKASDEDKGQAIILVNLLGTVMMFVLALLASLLFPQDTLRQAALVGGSLQSVGQVVASAAFLGDSQIKLAMLFKILRIMMLPVVIIFMKFYLKEDSINKIDKIPAKKGKLLPWYVFAFILVCLVNSFFNLPSGINQSAHYLSGWLEISALAAIGLRLNFKKFIQNGKAFLAFGFLGGALQALYAICLIFLLNI